MIKRGVSMKKMNWRLELKLLQSKLQTIIRQVDSDRAYLHHYTNAEGLYGILKSNKMRATNTRYLNDPQELKYATEMVKEILESNSPLETETKELDNFWIALLNKFEQLYKEIDIYIICFCENGDLLSQWRGYGSQGGGYSIELNRETIRNAGRNKEQNKYVIRKVEYSSKKQSQVINQICDTSAESIRKIEQTIDKEKLKDVVNKIIALVSKVLLYQIARFKQEAFKEENEWRIIYLVDNQDEYIKESFDFRFKNGLAIPYIELQLSEENGELINKLPINRIVCGPSLDTPRALKSLKLMKKRFGYDKVTIKKSSFTLRAD